MFFLVPVIVAVAVPVVVIVAVCTLRSCFVTVAVAIV